MFQCGCDKEFYFSFTCQVNSPEREIYRDPDVIRSEDKLEDDEVMKTNTAKKMLCIFRQMEENATKEEVPDGKELRVSLYLCKQSAEHIITFLFDLKTLQSNIKTRGMSNDCFC
jgi:hypothetical protein